MEKPKELLLKNFTEKDILMSLTISRALYELLSIAIEALEEIADYPLEYVEGSDWENGHNRGIEICADVASSALERIDNFSNESKMSEA